MTNVRILTIGTLSFFLVGCGEPTTVKTLKTPIPGVTLTFETTENGLMVSDRTKLVVHYTHDGKEDTKVIFDGDYVVISAYRWSKKGLTLCYKSGTVANFTNEIWFTDKYGFHSFHVNLKEDC